MELDSDVLQKLGAAFPEDELDFLPRAASGGMALGLPYIDARSVMRRLDAVVGAANWTFDFDMLSDDGKMVKGRLTVLGVTKCDAGESSAEDEPLKSAVSDALKRAAVHFGIARYLHYLPRIWAPFDPQKRRFIETPRLDPEAVRKALRICGVETAAAPPAEPSGAHVPERVTAALEGRHVGGSVTTAGELLHCSNQTCGKTITAPQAKASRARFGAPLCTDCVKKPGAGQAQSGSRRDSRSRKAS